jgi:creatinine amidohydrolase
MTIPNRTSRRLGRLAASAIGSELTEASALCLPVGAQEQHGPHLPLNTDTVIAEQFTELLVERHGEEHDLWMLPAIPYGLSLEHAWAPGTVSLRIDSLKVVLDAVIGEHLRATPARRLLIVNGHGGNRGFLEPYLRELQHDQGIDGCIIHPAALVSVRIGDPATPEIHAGIHETAMMLALAPTEVHIERLPAEFGTPQGDMAELVLDRGATWPWSSGDDAIAACGVIGGDPREATAAAGQTLLDSALEAAGPVVARLTGRKQPHSLSHLEAMCHSPPPRSARLHATA